MDTKQYPYIDRSEDRYTLFGKEYHTKSIFYRIGKRTFVLLRYFQDGTGFITMEHLSREANYIAVNFLDMPNKESLESGAKYMEENKDLLLKEYFDRLKSGAGNKIRCRNQDAFDVVYKKAVECRLIAC